MAFKILIIIFAYCVACPVINELFVYVFLNHFLLAELLVEQGSHGPDNWQLSFIFSVSS